MPRFGAPWGVQVCADDLYAAQERRNPFLSPGEAAHPRAARCFGADTGTANAALCGGLSRAWIRRGIKLGAEPLASRLRGRSRAPPGALALMSPLAAPLLVPWLWVWACRALSRFPREPAGCDVRLGGLKPSLSRGAGSGLRDAEGESREEAQEFGAETPAGRWAPSPQPSPSTRSRQQHRPVLGGI